MINNPVLTAMLRRKSIRRYTPEAPSDEVVTAIGAAGSICCSAWEPTPLTQAAEEPFWRAAPVHDLCGHLPTGAHYGGA
jgi:hypothetical protein